MIAGLFHLVWKIICNTVVILLCAGLIFVGYKANQPMMAAGAPGWMTYVEFIQDLKDRLLILKNDTISPTLQRLILNQEMKFQSKLQDRERSHAITAEPWGNGISNHDPSQRTTKYPYTDFAQTTSPHHLKVSLNEAVFPLTSKSIIR